MIRRLSAILCGIALTWFCAATGLFLLGELNGPFRCNRSWSLARGRISELKEGLYQFKIDNNRCPTGNGELLASHYVTSQSLVDPWGTPLAFSCSDEDVDARSAGPDHIFETDDDVTERLR
jgi:hypothetical protein